MAGKKKLIEMRNEFSGESVKKALEQFVQYGKVKNLSDYTIVYYEKYCNEFITFLLDNGIEYTDTIKKNMVESYILYQRERLENPISINSSLRAVRAFLYYCMKLNYTKEFKIELIKAEKKIKETYTDTELNLLLKKPDLKKCNFAEYRDWVIINYLLATGNRLQTIINLRIRDIDFENGTILLQKTKNKRQQIIPISKTLSSVLQEYLQFRKGHLDNYLFCNIVGVQLNKDTLTQAIRRYNQKRGVMKTSIHLFRHTFAKKWILANGDIFRLQKILGHSSLEVVREYVNMFSDDLHKDFDRFNPLEQLSHNKEKIRMK